VKVTDEWINPAAFQLPASNNGTALTFGDAPRDVARAPGAWQVDLGLARHITLTERVGLEFRAEEFNLFNHPQYGQPQSDFSVAPGAAGFGSIITTVNTGPVGTGTPREAQFMLRVAF
jgi:hypothetical protein